MEAIDALVKVLRTPDIEVAMAALLDLAAGVTSAENPSLFLLSTQQAAFVGVFGTKKGLVHERTKQFADEHCLVAWRGNVAIGFLEWDTQITFVNHEHRTIIGAVIEEIYRRAYASNFFTQIRQPVDFTNQDTYFRDTAKLLSDTLGMEMVAIRQFNGQDSLGCRAFYHHPDRFSERVDFDGPDIPPPFNELILETRAALSKHTPNQLEVKFETVDPNNIQRYGFLLNDEQLKDVTAFAIFPIVLGDEFFGMVSCSTTAPFSFTSLEKNAIQTAMQLISVAINNYLSFHEAKRMTDATHDQLFSMTELEIAQSARHELQNIEAEQTLHLDELDALSRIIRDKELPTVVTKLKETVLNLSSAISKLKFNGVHAEPKLEKTSIAQLWIEATGLMQDRLNMMGIKPKYVGAPLDGHYYADWLREAFLNLLLNSIDAFKNRPRQNRSITLVAKKESEASQYHILDYSDTAGGIVFSKLNIPEPIKEANPGMSPEQLIFQPKVTSKRRERKGAGWGLYLVRQALRLHGGSIALRSNTIEGCTFRVQLSAVSQNRNPS